jgi:hypothetical protein
MSLTIQAISSHPLLVRAVEEIFADVKEYPYLPSAPNEREAARQTNSARLFSGLVSLKCGSGAARGGLPRNFAGQQVYFASATCGQQRRPRNPTILFGHRRIR